MTKKLFTTLCILTLILSAGLIYAQGNKMIYQELLDADGEFPGEGTIEFRTYFQARPNFVLDGPNVPNGFLAQMNAARDRFLISYDIENISQLPGSAPWAPGDVLVIEMWQTTTRHIATANIEIEAGNNPQRMFAPENAVQLREPPTALFDSNTPNDFTVTTTANLRDGDPQDDEGVWVYQASEWAAAGKYWQIQFSTVGFEELYLTAQINRQWVPTPPAQRRYGPDFILLEYSVDRGEHWTPYGNEEHFGDDYWTTMPTSAEWITTSFELPAALEEQEDVRFRWYHLHDWAEREINGWSQIQNVRVTGYGEAEPPGPENPTIAINPNPAHNAEDVAIDLQQLRWRYIDEEDEYAQPLGFRVYFGTDPDDLSQHGSFVEYEEGEENYSLSREHAPRLEYETTYFWKVVPTTIDGGDDGRSGRRSRNESARQTVASRNDDGRRSRRVNNGPVRQTFAFRGDAENVPTWRFTTEEDGAPQRYTLTIRVDGRGDTSPLRPDSQTQFEVGARLPTITAHPGLGYMFTEWVAYDSDDLETPIARWDNPIVEGVDMMDFDVTAIAYFELLGDTNEEELDEPTEGDEYRFTGATFVRAIGAGASILRFFSSTNPEILTGLSNPDALALFYHFESSDDGVWRNGSVVMTFTVMPHDMWWRPLGGSWYQLDLTEDGDHWVWWNEANMQATFTIANLPGMDGRPGGGGSFAVSLPGETLPVELSSFTANEVNVSETAQTFVKLQWVSETETNMQGYRVHRATVNSLSQAEPITPSIIPATNSSETTEYVWEDMDVQAPNTYYYWLETIDNDLTFGFHGPVSVTLEEEEEEIPQVFTTKLMQNYPNPFNPSTLINFEIERGTEVSLSIYNVLGQKVKTLVDGPMDAGDYQREWNGTDDNGQPVTSGIYFYRLSTDNFNKIHKMMLVK